MPVRSHHTLSAPAAQSAECAADSWSSEVLPRLPNELDPQARTLKAFQRARAFACPADLLRGLLVYVLSPFGFRWLGAWGVLWLNTALAGALALAVVARKPAQGPRPS